MRLQLIMTNSFTLDSDPIIKQMIVSGILWSVGDTLSQLIERFMKRSKDSVEYSVTQTIRIATYAIFLWTPATFYWFSFLENTFPENDTTSIYEIAFERMLCDQLIWAPIVISSLFLWTSLLKGNTLSEALLKLKIEFFPTLKINYFVWPFVQLVNMSIVPVSYRLIFTNLVAIPWTVFLAFKSATSYYLSNRSVAFKNTLSPLEYTKYEKLSQQNDKKNRPLATPRKQTDTHTMTPALDSIETVEVSRISNPFKKIEISGSENGI